MKKILSIIISAIILISFIPSKSVSASSVNFSNINSYKFKFVQATTQFQVSLAIDLNSSSTWTIKKNGIVIGSNTDYLSYTASTTHMSVPVKTYVSKAYSFDIGDVVEFNASGTLVYCYANPSYCVNFDTQNIYGTTTPKYKDEWLDPNVVTLDDQLNAILPNGLQEYIVYSNSSGTYAEYFENFPIVNILSDPTPNDNKANISWSGNGDRCAYKLIDDSFVFEHIDLDSAYTTWNINGEMTILRSSQSISFDNKTYNSAISGYSNDANTVMPGDPLSVKVITPSPDFKTNKPQAYVEFVIDFPTVHPDDTLTLFHKSNYIPTRPQVKINGEWLLKGFGFQQLTRVQSTNFNIIDEKYIIRGERTLYTYKVLCNLANASNPLNIWSDVKYVDFVLSRPLANSDIKFTYEDDVTITILKVTPVDANANGIDDVTGEDMTTTPTPSNGITNTNPTNTYEQDNVENDTTDNYSGDLLDNFQNIISILRNFTSNMNGLMGFLPGEFTAVIVLSMSIGIFIFIFQTYRGAK